MRSFVSLAAAAAIAALACAEDIADPISAGVDFSDPKSVLGHVFWAARSGDTGRLGELCDVSANRAARRICAVTAASPDVGSFRKNFGRARLNGEPRISGDTAIIKFLYGPEGAARETMTLVRRDGRWLLRSF
jgi:hypothetical protein